MELQQTRNWLEEATNESKTEEEARWYLAMWYARGMAQNSWKDSAGEIASFCENGISYEKLEEEHFDQLGWAKEEESYEMADWEDEARSFYGK